MKTVELDARVDAVAAHLNAYAAHMAEITGLAMAPTFDAYLADYWMAIAAVATIKTGPGEWDIYRLRVCYPIAKASPLSFEQEFIKIFHENREAYSLVLERRE